MSGFGTKRIKRPRSTTIMLGDLNLLVFWKEEMLSELSNALYDFHVV
jgi:hypothetical protein